MDVARVKRIGGAAYSTYNTILNTYAQTEHCLKNNIPGSLVECGVAAGAQIGIMGLVCQELKSFRPIIGFDSFEGIPMAGEFDTCQPGIGDFTEPRPHVEDKESLLKSSGITVHSLENVLNNIQSWGLDLSQYRFIKGWFQHTLPKASPEVGPIALLRLDGDLYESTIVCLEHLFPKVSPGGVIIIDDWALTGCRRACDKYFESVGFKPIIQTVPDSTPVYFYKEATGC